MGTHLRALYYPINTNITGFRWYSKIFASLFFYLALEGLRALLFVEAMLHHITGFNYFPESDVYVWGNNAHGQLGIGDGQSMSSTPVHLDCLVGLCFVQLSAGGHHSLALTVSGTLFAWGRNR